MDPQIVIQDFSGAHNADLERSAKRLKRAQSYRDLSTICIIPTLGTVPAKVVQSWWGLMTPMNQKFLRMMVIGMEVGAAYSSAIEQILAHPELSQWKYVLTLEHDNMPPPDGLLNLYEAMDDYDVVGGLYWTKGEGGQPMIYGDPAVMPKNFMPQLPVPGEVQQCNGLGMGFTLFDLDLFRDERIERPWFRTVQANGQQYTQDLWFFENAGRAGYKFASDNRVRVGHYDLSTDTVW